jgi:membrane-bound inhibitor of C-type lysozyme
MQRIVPIVLVALILGAGCDRKPEPAPSAGTQSVVAPVAPPPAANDATAEPVLSWECDGGTTLTTKYLPRDRAISLGLHEGERKLPLVPAASGEKYQDGPITFWRKGSTAIYERTPAPQIDCRLAAG